MYGKYAAQAWGVFASKPLQLALVVCAVVAFIYYKGKADEKEKNIYANPPVDPVGDISANWDAKPLANEIYRVLGSAWSLSNDKEFVFLKIKQLNNNQLTKLYNTFSQLYYNKSKETLTEWIENEWYVSFWSVQDEILGRLRSLNLR